MFDWQRLVGALNERRWAQIVAAVFALLLLMSLYQKIKFFSNPHSLSNSDAVFAAISPLPDIDAWHLFGDYTAIKASLLPKTQLNLQLQGVFFAPELRLSQVIVAVPGQSAKVYRVGQTLPGGATIKEILANGVVITLGGQLQWLPLKVMPLQFGPSPAINLPDAD